MQVERKLSKRYTTFKEIYFEKYPSVYGPTDRKYEESMIKGKHGQFVPEEDDNTRLHQAPVVVVDHRTLPSRLMARKN